MKDDIGPREAELVKDFLGLARLALYVLALVSGAAVSANHFGLV